MTLSDRFLKNQVAIVTGATGTLGRVLAKSLLEQGAFVSVPYRDERKFLELVDFLGDLKDGLTGRRGDLRHGGEGLGFSDESQPQVSLPLFQGRSRGFDVGDRRRIQKI